MPQSATYNSSPKALAPFCTWQDAQSPLKIAIGSEAALAMAICRSAPVKGTLPATAGGIFTFSVRMCVPADVVKVSVLEISPILPARLTFASTSPVPPGGMCHGTGGSLAVVHPHDGLTFSMTSSVVPTLVSENKNGAVISPGLASYCFKSASKTKVPVPEGTAAAGAGWRMGTGLA